VFVVNVTIAYFKNGMFVVNIFILMISFLLLF